MVASVMNKNVTIDRTIKNICISVLKKELNSIILNIIDDELEKREVRINKLSVKMTMLQKYFEDTINNERLLEVKKEITNLHNVRNQIYQDICKMYNKYDDLSDKFSKLKKVKL